MATFSHQEAAWVALCYGPKAGLVTPQKLIQTDRASHHAMKLLTVSLILAAALPALAVPPVISNVRASQRPGTKLVDVYYDVSDADGGAQTVEMQVSADGGLTYSIPSPSTSGDIGAGVSLGANKHITWNAGTDWGGNFVAQTKVRVTAFDGTTPVAPPGLVLIPAGPFQMGDNFGEGVAEERPVHNVQVDGFYMDKYLITGALWDQVQAWGVSNGYSISSGSYKATNHPVQNITWYDGVKWCNARSQKEGLTPCYYTDVAQTVIYKTGNTDIQNPWVKWSANGYRLPTEAEWEKAARGGLSGNRYPWGDTISSLYANYSYTDNPYKTGNNPFTSPVGSYPANAYGLYDMGGNVWHWCWDWWGAYYGSAGSDINPRGLSSGSSRVARGGSWQESAGSLRSSYRLQIYPLYVNTGSAGGIIGFRCVRGL